MRPIRRSSGRKGSWEIAHGMTTVDQWLASFGHRAPEEFDLATPRWRERPDAVAALAGHLKDAQSPVARHRQRTEACAARIRELRSTLDDAAAREFDEKLSLAHRYLRFREDGKFYLMLAYDLLRDLALEAGRRLDIGTDVFLLREEELFDALATGIAPLHLLERRRLARAAEAEIDLPIPDHGRQDRNARRITLKSNPPAGSRLFHQRRNGQRARPDHPLPRGSGRPRRRLHPGLPEHRPELDAPVCQGRRIGDRARRHALARRRRRPRNGHPGGGLRRRDPHVRRRRNGHR